MVRIRIGIAPPAAVAKQSAASAAAGLAGGALRGGGGGNEKKQKGPARTHATAPSGPHRGAHMADFVLQPFSADEEKILRRVRRNVQRAILQIVTPVEGGAPTGTGEAVTVVTAAAAAVKAKVEGNELNELEGSSDAAAEDGSPAVVESTGPHRATDCDEFVGRADNQSESVAAVADSFDSAVASHGASLSTSPFSDSSDRGSSPSSPPSESSSSSTAPAQSDPAPRAHSPPCPRCRCLHGCDSNAALAHRLQLVMTRFNGQLVRAEEEEDEDE
jgi:hypothetical protein